MWRWALATCIALCLTDANAASSVPHPLRLPTSVNGGAVEPNGALWFSGWTDGVSFFLPPDDAINAQSLFQLLKSVAENGRSIIVTFDPTSGQFDTARGRIAYRICGVESQGQHFGQQGGVCPTSSSPISFGTAIPESLSLGVADSAAGRATSIGELGAALEGGKLDPALRVIALRARSEAYSTAALKKDARADTDLVAALHDVAAWTALAPADKEAWLKAAALLADLGAYDEAIRAYRAIAARWREENYRSSVRIGAIYRGKAGTRKRLQNWITSSRSTGPR